MEARRLARAVGQRSLISTLWATPSRQPSVCVTITTTSILLQQCKMAASRSSTFLRRSQATSSMRTWTRKCQLLISGKNRVPHPEFRWRPLCAPGVTKNVLIAVNSSGDMKHFHTTSGKELNKIQEPLTSFITCEYRPDGCAFLTAAYDGVIRTYDEQTRQLVSNLTGGGTGLPGHQSRVVCAKYVPDDPNIIVSGGWDG